METNNTQSNNDSDNINKYNPYQQNQNGYYDPNQNGYYSDPYQNQPFSPYNDSNIPPYAEKLMQNEAKFFKTTVIKLAIFTAIAVLNTHYLYYIFYYPAAAIVQALGENASSELIYFISWLTNDLCSYLIPALAAFLLFKNELKVKMPYPPHPNCPPVLNGALTFFAACFLGSLAGLFANAVAGVLDSLFGTGEITDAMEDIVPPQGEMPGFWIMFFFVAVVAPVFEELIFRKLLLYPLRRHGNWFAIIMTALLFGFYHGNFDQMPYAFVVGMLFALLAVNTNSVIPSMILHVVNNTLVTLSQYLVKVTGEVEPFLSISNLVSEGLGFSFWLGIPAVAIMIAYKLFKTTHKSPLPPKYQAKVMFTNPAFYVFLVLLALMMV